MSELVLLTERLQKHFTHLPFEIAFGEVTMTLTPESLLATAIVLKDNANFAFEQLQDVCGIDYLDYGFSEWTAEKATGQGFERAAQRVQKQNILGRTGPRFGVAYHLLSLTYQWRLRLVVLVDEPNLLVPSLTAIWPSANWFERETFDLFGIVFEGHPDLRRILTDYGFVGYPFRKDFPLSGHVEVRYDAELGQVIYDPVDIEPRILVPKIIRRDQRYSDDNSKIGG